MNDSINVGDVIFGGYCGGTQPYRVTRVFKDSIRVHVFGSKIIDKESLRARDDRRYRWFRTQEQAEADWTLTHELTQFFYDVHESTMYGREINLTREEFEQIKAILGKHLKK